MSTTRTTPACSAPGISTAPSFTAPNVTVKRARTASPSTTPVVPFTPEGMSTATIGAYGLIQARDRRRPVILRHAAESGAEDRVHDDVRARELSLEARPGGRSARGCRAPPRDASRSWRPALGARPDPPGGSRSSALPTAPGAARRPVRLRRCSPCRTRRPLGGRRHPPATSRADRATARPARSIRLRGVDPARLRLAIERRTPPRGSGRASSDRDGERHRVRLLVGERDQHVGDAEGVRSALRVAVEPDPGRA